MCKVASYIICEYFQEIHNEIVFLNVGICGNQEHSLKERSVFFVFLKNSVGVLADKENVTACLRTFECEKLSAEQLLFGQRMPMKFLAYRAENINNIFIKACRYPCKLLTTIFAVIACRFISWHIKNAETFNCVRNTVAANKYHVLTGFGNHSFLRFKVNYQVIAKRLFYN